MSTLDLVGTKETIVRFAWYHWEFGRKFGFRQAEEAILREAVMKGHGGGEQLGTRSRGLARVAVK